MKKSILINFLFLVIAFVGFDGYAQTGRVTINIDFGDAGLKSPEPEWNNITNPTSGSIANLTNTLGNNTGISIAITAPFHAMNNVSHTADDTLGMHPRAVTDNFYGNGRPFNNRTVPFSTVTVSNLDVNKAYSFAVYGARGQVTDNRDTQVIVEGLTTAAPVNFNPSSNKSHVVRVSNMRPKADGTITITFEVGPNNVNSSRFFHLSAMKISYEGDTGPGAKTLAVKYPNSAVELKAGKTATIVWERNNVATVDIAYSVNNGATWQPIALGVSAANRSFVWTVPSAVTQTALVKITDSADPSITDVSDQPFSIFEGNGRRYTIVVLGSSTANGGGTTVKDSAWVWMYRQYLSHKRSDFNVVNLAVGGYSTASILPNVNPENNIIKALSLDPDAIIINMPSNDAASGRSVDAQMANYDQIEQLTMQANVPLWVTTPQPRNFSQDKVQIQLGMIDATYAKFGQRFTVDFWTGFNTAENTMKAMYDSGDGVHMNNAAHRILLERIIGEDINGYLDRGPLSSSKEVSTNIKIYPNPANGAVSISTSGDYRIEKVQLVNLAGVKVLEKINVKGAVEKLDVSGLAKGLYYLQLHTNKGLYHSKLVVQ